MLQAASTDTKKATARGNSQPPSVPAYLLSPPVSMLGNQAALRLRRKCDCGAGPDCDCDMGNDKKKKERESPKTALHRKPLASGALLHAIVSSTQRPNLFSKTAFSAKSNTRPHQQVPPPPFQSELSTTPWNEKPTKLPIASCACPSIRPQRSNSERTKPATPCAGSRPAATHKPKLHRSSMTFSVPQGNPSTNPLASSSSRASVSTSAMSAFIPTPRLLSRRNRSTRKPTLSGGISPSDPECTRPRLPRGETCWPMNWPIRCSRDPVWRRPRPYAAAGSPQNHN